MRFTSLTEALPRVGLHLFCKPVMAGDCGATRMHLSRQVGRLSDKVQILVISEGLSRVLLYGVSE
jgi:hypothetical protein